MFESFPSLADNRTLQATDFSRFSLSFAEILQKYVPTAKQVVFAFSTEQAEHIFSVNNSASELLAVFKQVKEGGIAWGSCLDYLMLPFTVKDGGKIVALISGTDSLFLQKVSTDWLEEMLQTVENDFFLLKQAWVDPHTGLLNIANLFSLLDRYGMHQSMHLILVELVPKKSAFHEALRYVQRCANLLVDFIPADSVVHFIGQSAFAIVLQHTPAGKSPEIEQALVSYLKKAGCHRVHVGCSITKAQIESGQEELSGRRLLDEAWTALRHAEQRGPFSFCNYAQLAFPEKHPLAPPHRNIVRRLSRLWASSKKFCLIQFAGDNESGPAGSLVLPHILQEKTVEDGDTLFVFLDKTTASEGLEWAKKIINRADDPERNMHVSAGVANYPYCGFKKSELILNCRKALLHAAFYGQSSAVIFDAVSLNISGDIYFGDGDLTRAVKEYEKGLKCDPLDVNLHNSLGVTLAMMNKLAPALASFKRGLALDNCNFMALYNLGLGEQSRNNKAEALAYLEKALQYHTPEEGGQELVDDLTLQLGILSCELGRYGAALDFLIPWLEAHKASANAGRVHYYLGEAYYGQKDNRNAMTALQRALRFDEMDERAMNLLGRIYLAEGEGDQIALSLCRKSVELEPSNLRYMLDLAEVLLQCGLYRKAREYLYRCLKNRQCKLAAQFLLGKSYAAEGQFQRAGSWFAKVLTQKKIPPEIRKTAQQELKNKEYESFRRGSSSHFR